MKSVVKRLPKYTVADKMSPSRDSGDSIAIPLSLRAVKSICNLTTHYHQPRGSAAPAPRAQYLPFFVKIKLAAKQTSHWQKDIK